MEKRVPLLYSRARYSCRFWRSHSYWRRIYEGHITNGRINCSDTTRFPLSSPFLCTKKLSLPLPQHCQSSAVTHLHFPVQLSCLSSSCGDKWNWWDGRGMLAQEGLPGTPVQTGPCCLLQRAAWLQGTPVSQGTSKFLMPGTCRLCAKPPVELHFPCPRTWRRLLVQGGFACF